MEYQLDDPCSRSPRFPAGFEIAFTGGAHATSSLHLEVTPADLRPASGIP